MRRLALALVTTFVLALPLAAPAHAAPEAGSVQLVGAISRTSGGLTFTTSTCLHVWGPPSPTPEVGWSCQSSFRLQGAYAGLDAGHLADTVRFSGGWYANGRWYSVGFDVPRLLVATYDTGPHTAAGTVWVNGRSGPATFSFVSEFNAATGNPTFQGAIDYALT